MTIFDSETYAKDLAGKKGLEIPDSIHIPPENLATDRDTFYAERARVLRIYKDAIKTDAEMAEFIARSFLYTPWNKQPGDVRFVIPNSEPRAQK